MQRCASGRNPGQQQYQALFKFKLRLTDELGNQWPVQYEGFVSSGQRHYRLTAGWTALIKHKKITVGELLTSPCQRLGCKSRVENMNGWWMGGALVRRTAFPALPDPRPSMHDRGPI